MEYSDVADVVVGVGGRAATTPNAGWLLYEFVERSGARDILELGFAHGNSTCYMAAALDERGEGAITTIDRESARDRQPNILELLDRTGLGRYVTPIFAHTSYNWELKRLLEEHREGRTTVPVYDFAFIDGAHTWEADGLAFFLVEKMLKPGGVILFDDIHWTLAASPTMRNSTRVQELSDEERKSPQIMRVFSLLAMQHPNLSDFTVRGNWGWARKTAEGAGAVDPEVVSTLYADAEKHSWALA